jgi:YbbR domain-containing protein
MMKNYLLEIKKIFSARDNVAKVVCVLLAIILWLYISKTNKGELEYKIPITFINLPETLVKSKISNRYVTAILTGKKDNLKNINIKSIKAVVNLEQPEIGINKTYSIDLIKDEIPENIDLNLSIKDVSLVVERKITKKVIVKANIVDKVLNGYVLGRIMIVPESINISGPESLLKTIDFVQTEKISIAKASGRFIKDAAIENKDIPDVNIDTLKVRVIIPIVESVNSVEFKKKVILKNINNNYNYILNPEEVSAYLQSDKPNIEPFEQDVEVFIDIGSLDLDELLKEGNENYIEKYYSVNSMTIKDGVKVISIFPDIISVKILLK